MRVLLFLAAALSLAACSPAKRPLPAAERPDTATARAETLVAVAPPPIREQRVSSQNPAAMALVGSWDFAPPPGMRGPHLSITVDSARGNEFFGRITRALSGDLETSSMFDSFRGQVDEKGVARADIKTREAQARAVHIAGTIQDGAWVLTSLVWGQELSAPAEGKVWRGRKAG